MFPATYSIEFLKICITIFNREALTPIPSPLCKKKSDPIKMLSRANNG